MRWRAAPESFISDFPGAVSLEMEVALPMIYNLKQEETPVPSG